MTNDIRENDRTIATANENPTLDREEKRNSEENRIQVKTRNFFLAVPFSLVFMLTRAKWYIRVGEIFDAVFFFVNV